MNNVDPARMKRSFADIEADLLKAEEDFGSAQAAIAEAKKKLTTALERINTHQQEFDEATYALRQRSSPGTHWGSEDAAPNVLSLRVEDEIASSRPAQKAEPRRTEEQEEEIFSSPIGTSERTSVNKGGFQLLKSQIGSLEKVDQQRG